MRDPTRDLQPQTCIGHSLIQHFVCILQAHTYIVIYCATAHGNKTHIPYNTPNDNFTANDSLFYKSKVSYLHYTLQSLFD